MNPKRTSRHDFVELVVT